MKLTKETLKTIIKEELEAALEEGHAPFTYGYKSDPSRRPVNPGTGGPNPDYPPKETEVDKVEQMKAIASMIRRETGEEVKITINGVDIEDEVGTK